MLWARQIAPESPSWVSFRAADPRKIPIDPNGNLTSKAEGTDNWTYTWNGENQLTKVEKNGAEVARLSYDPVGRRVEKVAGGVPTSYTYDAEDVLREVRGVATVKYVHGPGVDEPLAREDAGGALECYHADGVGSIARRTTQAGTIAHDYRSDAWGTIESGAAEPGYAFTGREWDTETGLYYYRARYYYPNVGRFTSEDPIGFDAGGVNFYAYVESSPLNALDPSGLSAWELRPCLVRVFFETRRLGSKKGWRYAHCMASCRTRQECGDAQSQWAQAAKEAGDTTLCVLTGNADYCNTAEQPTDYDDNAHGYTCPQGQTCEERCSRIPVEDGPPGPFYDYRNKSWQDRMRDYFRYSY